MKWAKERDLLIAQTMAFVQSVTGKKPEADARIDLTAADEIAAGEIEKVERPAEIVQMPRPSPVAHSELRKEIQGRVAAFRAHQQLFHRERDEYFNSVLTKVRASMERQPKARDN